MKSCAFLILLFALFMESCVFFQTAVKVETQDEGETTFAVRPFPLSITDGKDKSKVAMNYSKQNDKVATITSTFNIESDREQLEITGVEIKANNVKYFVSTYDLGPVNKKGRDRYIHEITVYLPEVDFVKMIKSKLFSITIGDKTYSSKESRWSKVTQSIQKKSLLN